MTLYIVTATWCKLVKVVTTSAGFLGAGKTTLVHNVLNANHNHKIAVIVNEFGDTSGIESAMVTTSQVPVTLPAAIYVPAVALLHCSGSAALHTATSETAEHSTALLLHCTL